MDAAAAEQSPEPSRRASYRQEFDRVAAFVARARADTLSVREFQGPTTVAELGVGLPVHVGDGANSGIILRGDTFVELGSPRAGSCSFLLWADEPALVHDGRITVIGPDLAESEGASLPFGQVLMVAGAELGVEHHAVLEQAQHVGDRIEGYMVRSASHNLWGRVSKAAAAKGFCFETLGRALNLFVKQAVVEASAVEVLFVTSSKEAVRRLDEIAGTVRQVGADLAREHWKAKGYDLDCSLDCRSCEERTVCDDIREIVAVQKRKNKKRTAGEPGGFAGGE